MPYTNPQVQRQDLLAGYNSELINAIPLTAGATGTVNGVQQENLQNLGLVLIVTTANRTSTITYTPSLQMLMPDGSTWYSIWTAAAAINSNASTVYAFYAQSALTDFIATEKKNIAIPRRFRVILTVGSSGSMDVQADYYMIA